jgi:hypothetical protein
MLEALLALRADKFPGVPEDLLVRVFELEQEAQYETERGPTLAMLRDLIVDWGDD